MLRQVARFPAARGAEYSFQQTREVAGTDDLHLRDLSTDVLHWRGVSRIAAQGDDGQSHDSGHRQDGE